MKTGVLTLLRSHPPSWVQLVLHVSFFLFISHIYFAVLGKNLDGWAGERWLDVRRIDLLTPIMRARLDLAVTKRCDGVEPDNVKLMHKYDVIWFC